MKLMIILLYRKRFLTDFILMVVFRVKAVERLGDQGNHLGERVRRLVDRLAAQLVVQLVDSRQYNSTLLRHLDRWLHQAY